MEVLIKAKTRKYKIAFHFFLPLILTSPSFNKKLYSKLPVAVLYII